MVREKNSTFPMLSYRRPERPAPEKRVMAMQQQRKKKLEYFLMGLSPTIIENNLGKKLRGLLDKYRRRKAKWDRRQFEVGTSRVEKCSHCFLNPLLILIG